MDDRSAMNIKSSDRLKQEIDNEQRFNFVQVSIDCIVKMNNEIVLQILTNNKEKTLKWAVEDVKKYL